MGEVSGYGPVPYSWGPLINPVLSEYKAYCPDDHLDRTIAIFFNLNGKSATTFYGGFNLALSAEHSSNMVSSIYHGPIAASANHMGLAGPVFEGTVKSEGMTGA